MKQKSSSGARIENALKFAVILDAALNTVKKRVQNILLKLRIETRLAAALRAAELLGIANADARPEAYPETLC